MNFVRRRVQGNRRFPSMEGTLLEKQSESNKEEGFQGNLGSLVEGSFVCSAKDNVQKGGLLRGTVGSLGCFCTLCFLFFALFFALFLHCFLHCFLVFLVFLCFCVQHSFFCFLSSFVFRLFLFAFRFCVLPCRTDLHKQD